MRIILRTLIGIVLFAGLIYAVSTYTGKIQEIVGVKGLSTQKANEVSGQIGTDIQKQVGSAAAKTGEIKLSEIASFFIRFQKIPQDVTALKDFATGQIDSVLKSRGK